MIIFINDSFHFKIKKRQNQTQPLDKMEQLIQNADNLYNQINNTLFNFKDVSRNVSQQSHRRTSSCQQYRQQNNKIKYIIEQNQQEIEISQDLICLICQQPFIKPVKLDCGHIFCYRCLYLQQQIQQIYQCPICNQEISQITYIDSYIEQRVNQIINQNKQPILHDLVLTLISDNSDIPNQSIGYVSQIDNGFVSEDMSTIIIDDKLQSSQQNLIQTKIYTVETSSGQWIGKQDDLDLIYKNQLRLSTRIKQKSIIINKMNLQKSNYKPQQYNTDDLIYESQETRWIVEQNQYYQINSLDNILILTQYDDLLKKYQVLNNNLYEYQISFQELQNNYLALEFNYITDEIQRCAGCNLKLKNPIQLQCGCYYCYYCAQKLINLQLNCIQCGKQIQSQIHIQDIDISLLIEVQNLNKNIPCSLDIGFPCECQNQTCILESDPTQVNCMLLTQQGTHIYQNINQIFQKPIQSFIKCIRPRTGLGILKDSQFFFCFEVKPQDFRVVFINSEPQKIEVKKLFTECLFLIPDLRQEILRLKQQGKQRLQKIEAENFEKIKKQKIEEKLKKEVKKQKQKLQDFRPQLRKRELNLLTNKQIQQIDQKRSQSQNYKNQNEVIKSSKMVVYWELIYEISSAFPSTTTICSGCFHIIKNPVILPCNHITCKTCACLLQQMQIGCLICKNPLKSQFHLKSCFQLNLELVQIPQKIYKKGVDLGGIVVDKNTGYMGIITYFESLNKIQVTFANQQKNLKYEDLTQIEVDQVTNDKINIGSPVILINNWLDGIVGIVMSINQQNKNEYTILLQTTITININRKFIKKVKMKEVKYSFEYFQQEFKRQQKIKLQQLEQKAENEINNMSVKELQEQLKYDDKPMWI